MYTLTNVLPPGYISSPKTPIKEILPFIPHNNDLQQVIEYTRNFFAELSVDWKDIIMVDMTACSGCESIAHAKDPDVKLVYSFEIEPDRFLQLEKDIRCYSETVKHKILPFNYNSLDFIENCKIHLDLVVCDPPWGGSSYKNQESVLLPMKSSTKEYSDISDFITEHINKSTVWALKPPVNWAHNSYIFESKGFTTRCYPIYRDTKSKGNRHVYNLFLVSLLKKV